MEASQIQDEPGEVLHAAMRGAVASMAMSGMRNVTVHLGLVEETPPQEIVGRKARGLIKQIPKQQRPAAIELFHWTYGAIAGAVYGALPDPVRRAPGSGPLYGLLVWVGFEAGLGPLLGLKHARRPPVAARIATIADHLLYGFVLSELRTRPRR